MRRGGNREARDLEWAGIDEEDREARDLEWADIDEEEREARELEWANIDEEEIKKREKWKLALVGVPGKRHRARERVFSHAHTKG